MVLALLGCGCPPQAKITARRNELAVPPDHPIDVSYLARPTHDKCDGAVGSVALDAIMAVAHIFSRRS